MSNVNIQSYPVFKMLEQVSLVLNVHNEEGKR